MLFNTEKSFGLVARLFHWTMALIIIGMLALGLYMSGLAFTPEKLKLYGIHKSIGGIVLGMVTLRLIWRFINKQPKLPEHMPKIEKLGAHASHYALYLCMFLMPLSGWMLSSAAGIPVSVFGWFTLPDLVGADQELAKLLGQVHELVGYGLIALIVAHAAAALKHHFINKDDVLKRMLHG